MSLSKPQVGDKCLIEGYGNTIFEIWDIYFNQICLLKHPSLGSKYLTVSGFVILKEHEVNAILWNKLRENKMKETAKLPTLPILPIKEFKEKKEETDSKLNEKYFEINTFIKKYYTVSDYKSSNSFDMSLYGEFI